jgi:hypothetical protein
VGTGGSYLSYPVAQGAETFIGPLNTLTLDASGIALSVIKSAIQQGIALNGEGFAWDNGTSLATITWQTLADRIQYANAITQPTNSTTLNVNNTVRIQNGETTTSPTPYLDIIAGATTSISLVGNKGTAGQVLTSGGPSGSLSWGSGGGGSVGTLQDVVTNSPDLQGTPPTTNQVIQYNGTNPVWVSLPPVVVDNLQNVLISGNITDQQMIFRTDPLISQLTLNNLTNLLANYNNYNVVGGFTGSHTTDITKKLFSQQAYIGGLGVYNVAKLEVNGDPENDPTNLKSQVSLLEEEQSVGKNVTTTFRPVGITQTNTGATASSFTVTTDSDFLVNSDNVTVNATSLTIPAIGNPTTSQITQDGLTCNDTTNSWFSYYRKSGAYISNIANTIYTQILNGGINFLSTGGISGNVGATGATFTDTSNGTSQAVLVPTKLSVLSPLAGYSAQTNIELINGNATAGNTTGVPSMDFYKFGRNVAQNDVISSIFFYAKNYLGTKTQYGKIECVATNSSAGASDDGALDFYSCVNGTSSLVMRLNGADNENNSFRPLDMNGNNIKTASGNLTIDTTGSSGSGILTLSALQSININSGSSSNIALNTSGGNLTLNTSTTGGIQLTGTALQSASAGGNSGQHLVITLNGTTYKIKLENA